VNWLHVVLDAPVGAHDRLRDYWQQALGWPVTESWPGHPELRSFKPPTGHPYVHLQRIEGPARVHLDLESGQPADAVGHARSLGATLVSTRHEWTTLTSPGGLPFCVIRARNRRPPEPILWPQGHRSRLVQLSLDSPTDRHDQEVAFWRDLLTGRWVESSSPEFECKWHDDAGSPIQLLFQRLAEPTGSVRAHLDLGTDDVTAETQRHRDLGATDIGPGRGWHTLQDPAGLPFCVTDNSPAQTSRRDLT
jgi:Glyoxalase-like domain